MPKGAADMAEKKTPPPARSAPPAPKPIAKRPPNAFGRLAEKRSKPPARRETMEVDVSWLEREPPPSGGKRATEAKAPPSTRNASKPPASKRAAANPAPRRPPTLTGAAARKETLEVRAEWLESESTTSGPSSSGKRGSKRPVVPPPLPPSEIKKARKPLPPPIPREEKTSDPPRSRSSKRPAKG